ncbi:MAG: 5-formyltetrahydrofolate cyclo-ligase [Pelotomaculum sp.]|nr:5-formyltetrahydrofolate cyclo-ligase [Pelotomaculum sp.]
MKNGRDFPGDAEVLRTELRKKMLKARAALAPAGAAEKSARIVKRLVAMDEYRQARTIMSYVDFRGEVQTGDLIVRAMADGKRVAVPVADVAGRQLKPSLLVDFPGDLEPNAWGIMEPKPRCLRFVDPAGLDLVVVPGLAFDLKGYRLGYGSGFYDRFLPLTGKGTVFVGLAYELQLQIDVYHRRHDVPVHYILTEERLIDCRD